jgi:hypothetical protein
MEKSRSKMLDETLAAPRSGEEQIRVSSPFQMRLRRRLTLCFDSCHSMSLRLLLVFLLRKPLKKGIWVRERHLPDSTESRKRFIKLRWQPCTKPRITLRRRTLQSRSSSKIQKAGYGPSRSFLCYIPVTLLKSVWISIPGTDHRTPIVPATTALAKYLRCSR